MIGSILNNELLIAVLVVTVSDGIAFVWLLRMRRQLANSELTSIPIFMLVLVLTVMCLAHFLGLRLVWQNVDPLAADSDIGLLMIAVTIFPGAPPALLFAWCVVESIADTGVEHTAGMRTARRQVSDYSRAKSLAAKGQIEAAVRAYRAYYNADKKEPKPLFMMYRLLYTKDRRDQAADVLREIMRTYNSNEEVWARAATELANYYQNDVRDTDSARRILRQIAKKAPKTTHGRLAGGRLMGAWDSSAYWTPPED